jgi:hypothetical protein
MPIAPKKTPPYCTCGLPLPMSMAKPVMPKRDIIMLQYPEIINFKKCDEENALTSLLRSVGDKSNCNSNDRCDGVRGNTEKLRVDGLVTHALDDGC